MKKIYLVLGLFVGLFVVGCITTKDTDPQSLSELPSDPINKLTPEKIVGGEYYFNNPQISLDGRTSCSNCHAADRGMKTPSPEFPSGCGVGCVLLSDGTLIPDPNFKSESDIMPINSYGGIGAGYQQGLGMSNRFGMTGKDDEDIKSTLKHFKLESFAACDGLLFQAFVALSGHKLLLKERVLQDTTGIKLLNRAGLVVNEQTNPDSIAFFIACTLDAFQRSFYPYNARRELTVNESLGKILFDDNCAGCHSNEMLGGGLEYSHTPNLDVDAPDCYQDVFGEKENLKYPLRNTKPLRTNLKDHFFYGVDGRIETAETNLENYMTDHYNFFRDIGIIKSDLKELDIENVEKYLNSLYSEELATSWMHFIPDSLLHY